MDKDIFETIKVVGFGNETKSYIGLTKAIVTSIVQTMNSKCIRYDYENLINKINTLRIERRDGKAHEHSPKENTIYLSTIGMKNEKISDEDMVVATTHELVHLMSADSKDDSFYQKYYGYDEFFTEFWTSLIVSKIGGVNMENHYKKNMKGYFYNSNDNEFIRKLSDKVGYPQLLDTYVNKDVEEIEKLVGIDTLLSMNRYYDYYYETNALYGKGLREFNSALETPAYAVQKLSINNYAKDVNKNIMLYEDIKRL